MLLALLVAFSFSAITTVALAAHFHYYGCGGGCSPGHGFQHGDYGGDNAYWARVFQHPANPNGFWTRCRLRRQSNDTLIAGNETTYGNDCAAFSNWAHPEYQAYAKVHSFDAGYPDMIEEHRHNPH
jgi:hypothetical protein